LTGFLLRAGALAPAVGIALSAVPLLSAQPRASGPPVAGRWAVTLQVDAPGTTRSLSGTIVLIAVGGGNEASYRGSYRIPFSTAGLAPDAAPVLAVTGRGDSVRIVLNPSASEGHAELRGVWGVGGIDGEWRWVGGAAVAPGRFELRRGRD